MAYTITEISHILGVNRSTINRQLNNLLQQIATENATEYATKCNNKFIVTDKGFSYLKKINSVKVDYPKEKHIKDDTVNDNALICSQQKIIDMLQEQIAIKDKQIADLMQQAENYQVLLLNSSNNILMDNSPNVPNDINVAEHKPKKFHLFGWLSKN